MLHVGCCTQWFCLGECGKPLVDLPSYVRTDANTCASLGGVSVIRMSSGLT
jgi:hypothetical protein